ncbi:hypothetical protein EXD82_03560 [Peptacetobacter hominis]|uniref:Uncharacterized protein n=1 Tax=Peptacetobacter hominis TaxID=2743610 RepID=A0A544QW65_9FIRM|nr:hypothetical protein [Peptacetobacter hominis]TQQ84933.1 hypothetical protein EXD82_03560 [Peptacetobacter hominis]
MPLFFSVWIDFKKKITEPVQEEKYVRKIVTYHGDTDAALIISHKYKAALMKESDYYSKEPRAN